MGHVDMPPFFAATATARQGVLSVQRAMLRERKGTHLSTIATALGLTSTALFALMWCWNTMRHRSHLHQCVADLQRQRRLDRRLTGCVVDMERILDELPTSESPGHVPEGLVGHVRYLNGLRVEASDNAIRLESHTVRLRWPDGYLSLMTLAGKRCELAHGALVNAFRTLADAAREYERGLAAALQTCGDGPQARALTMPVRLLDEEAASEVARLRDACDAALAHAAVATGLPDRTFLLLEANWPIRRSETVAAGPDPYDGEIRPMGWHGFGGQPLLHVDAR
jgi:hypothetical protein